MEKPGCEACDLFGIACECVMSRPNRPEDVEGIGVYREDECIDRYNLWTLPGAVFRGLSLIRRLPARHCRLLGTVTIVVEKSMMADRRDGVAFWQSAANHLLLHAEPGSLCLELRWDLDVKLDIGLDSGQEEEEEEEDEEDGQEEGQDVISVDMEMATAILKPLLDARPGTLRECQIRLSERADRRLSKLTMEAAYHATGHPHAQNRLCAAAPFRFFDLPQEIRLAILEYTDLITPYNEVCWHPRCGFYGSFNCTDICQYFYDHGGDNDDRKTASDKAAHRGCAFRFCMRAEGLPTGVVGLYCRVRHGAYTARCLCWTAPRDLMTVSRAFYEEAAAVFYSRNRITVVDDCAPYEEDLSAGAVVDGLRLDASRFLTRFMWPGTTLGHMRTLELVFPRLTDTSRPYSMEDHVYHDWHYAIQHLAEHARLTNLKLIVHLSTLRVTRFDEDGALRQHQKRLAEVRMMSQASPLCRRLLRPMGTVLEHRILKEFRIHWEASWHCSFNCRRGACQAPVRSRRVDQQSICRNLRAREGRLDKIVMGFPYNRRLPAPGDKPESIPQWLQKHMGYIYPDHQGWFRPQ